MTGSEPPDDPAGFELFQGRGSAKPQPTELPADAPDGEAGFALFQQLVRANVTLWDYYAVAAFLGWQYQSVRSAVNDRRRHVAEGGAWPEDIPAPVLYLGDGPKRRPRWSPADIRLWNDRFDKASLAGQNGGRRAA